VSNKPDARAPATTVAESTTGCDEVEGRGHDAQMARRGPAQELADAAAQREQSTQERERLLEELARERRDHEQLLSRFADSRAERTAAAQRIRQLEDDLGAARAELARLQEAPAQRDPNVDVERELAACRESLRLRIAEQERLEQELRDVRALQDEGAARMSTLRQERDALAVRVRELEASFGDVPTTLGTPSVSAASTVSSEGSGLSLAASTSVTAPQPSLPALPRGAITVVQIDDQPAMRDAVRAALSEVPDVHYVCAQEPPGAIGEPCLLTLNLLARNVDPLALLSEADKWGLPEPRAFTYCAEAARSVGLGMIDYFPFPFDPEACAARLLERLGIQRLLAVSGDIELMTRLRAILGGARSSTTIALDARQALDLIGPASPEVVLIDLALPRGEGLELASRLRTEAATAALPLGLLWTQRISPALLRQAAARIVRDGRVPTADVGQALVAWLRDEPSGVAPHAIN